MCILDKKGDIFLQIQLLTLYIYIYIIKSNTGRIHPLIFSKNEK